MAGRRIVIAGGGFAGLAAARKLALRHDVVLVDRKGSFEFLPNLAEIVSGTRKGKTLRLRLDRWLEREGCRFVRGEVAAIRPERSVVEVSGGGELAYDVLIVALGAEVAGRDTPGVPEHAIPVRSGGDAARVRRRLRELRRGGEPFSVVIAGGGFVGIEVLGEILRAAGTGDRLAVTVVEPAERILPRLPRKAARAVTKRARPFGVRFLTRERVVAVEPGRTRLGSGLELAADLVVWAPGIAPPSVLAEAGLAGPGQFSPVDRSLRSLRHANVFVAGDAAHFGDGLAKQAYHATDMGRRAAANANRLLGGRRPKEFSPDEARFLVPFGDLTAVLVDEDREVISHPSLAAGRELVYQREMARLDPVRGWKSASRQGARLLEAFDPERMMEVGSELWYRAASRFYG